MPNNNDTQTSMDEDTQTFMDEYTAWATGQEFRITAEEMRGEVLETPDFEYLYQQELIKNKAHRNNYALFSKFLTDVMPNFMNDDDSWEYLEGMIAQGLLPDPRKYKISVSLNLGVDQRLHLVTPYNYDTQSQMHADILDELNKLFARQSAVLEPLVTSAINQIVECFAKHGFEVSPIDILAPRATNCLYMHRDYPS